MVAAAIAWGGCGGGAQRSGDDEDVSLGRAEALATAVDADVLRLHLEALQQLADDNPTQPGVRRADGTRAWARALLEDAGYMLSEQAFEATPRIQCGNPCAGINLIATWPDAPDGDALLVSAHLDVVNSPGVNDNGTGLATVVEIARHAAAIGLVDDVPLRFALFDREEAMAPLGAWAYLSGETALTTEEPPPGPVADGLLGVINVDMTGSNNGAPFADFYESLAGSDVLADAFDEHFAQGGGAIIRRPRTAYVDGWLDSDAFASAGVPAAGVASGAGGLKTEDEAARYGGTAGEPYAACNHAPCDNLDQVDVARTTDLARAAAWAVGRVAGRSSLVDDD